MSSTALCHICSMTIEKKISLIQTWHFRPGGIYGISFNTSTNEVPSITVSCVFLIAFFSLFVILCSFCCCNMQMCSQCEIIKVESALIPFVGLKSNKRKQEVPVKGEGKNGNGWARLSLQTTECMEWRVGEGEGIKKKGIHRFLGIHKSHIRGGGCFNGM